MARPSGFANKKDSSRDGRLRPACFFGFGLESDNLWRVCGEGIGEFMKRLLSRAALCGDLGQGFRFGFAFWLGVANSRGGKGLGIRVAELKGASLLLLEAMGIFCRRFLANSTQKRAARLARP